MNKYLKEHIVEDLNEILYSRSSKLSRKNTARLAGVIEKIKGSNSKSKIFKILGEFKNFFTDDDDDS